MAVTVVLLAAGCSEDVSPDPDDLSAPTVGIDITDRNGLHSFKEGSPDATVRLQPSPGKTVTIAIVARDEGGLKSLKVEGSWKRTCIDAHTGLATSDQMPLSETRKVTPKPDGTVPDLLRVTFILTEIDLGEPCLTKTTFNWGEGRVRATASNSADLESSSPIVRLAFPRGPAEAQLTTLNVASGYDPGGSGAVDGPHWSDHLRDMKHQAAAVQGSDLVFLQEVDRGANRTGKVDQYMAIRDELRRLGWPMNGHFAHVKDWDGGEVGLAVLSRGPIWDVQEHASEQCGARSVVIRFKTSVRGFVHEVFGLHFAPPRLDHEHCRIAQGEWVAAEAALSAFPTFIGGDSNSDPGSPTRNAFLERDLIDLRVGATLLPKNDGTPFEPGQAGIDILLASRHYPFAVVYNQSWRDRPKADGSVTVHDENISDHDRVVAHLTITDK